MSDERAPGTRKPYRISKPREKWTEEEHERFVTAINQHGRNWRKIVQEVGTRSVAQVRSHAQKYFLKLEKSGNTEEVPPARAKRPSTKPYPIKSTAPEGSNRSSQSSQPECKRPRRTERTITKPLHNDFTLLEESPRMSNECDSIAFLLSEEGNGSNNNMPTAQATCNNNSTSNGAALSPCQRQSSALSSAELNPATTPAGMEHTVPSPDSPFFPPDSFVDGDPDPTDASSSGAGKVDQNPPNYGEFFDVVGKVYTNQQGSNKQLIQQLGAHQRSELVHMLDHLTGELRDSVTSKDLTPAPIKTESVTELPVSYGECTLAGLPPPADISNNLVCQFSSPCSLTEGGSASNFPLLEQEVPTPHATGQGPSLLSLDAQPPDLESSDWRLSMSDDLSTLLPNPIIDCSPYTHSQMIDSKIFDY